MWITDQQQATILAGRRDQETGSYFIDLSTAKLNPVLVTPLQKAAYGVQRVIFLAKIDATSRSFGLCCSAGNLLIGQHERTSRIYPIACYAQLTN
jgi:hypothetical protein